MISEKTERFLNNLGGYHREPITWTEVGLPVPSAILAELQVYTSAELGIRSNVADALNFVPPDIIFVVSHNEGLYLVNTEGYNIARYMRYVGTTRQGPGYDETIAKQEGWALFECDDGYLRIQKLDDPLKTSRASERKFLHEQARREGYVEYPHPFISDYAALTHVITRANTGSMMHKIALGLHGTSVDRKFTHPADDGLRGYGERGA